MDLRGEYKKVGQLASNLASNASVQLDSTQLSTHPLNRREEKMTTPNRVRLAVLVTPKAGLSTEEFHGLGSHFVVYLVDLSRAVWDNVGVVR